MTVSEFEGFFDQFVLEARRVMFLKMADYTREERATGNFEKAAEDLGLEPLQVWGVYFHKHVQAAQAFARTRDATSEPIRGRFVDLLNYAVLGAALAKEVTT